MILGPIVLRRGESSSRPQTLKQPRNNGTKRIAKAEIRLAKCDPKNWDPTKSRSFAPVLLEPDHFITRGKKRRTIYLNPFYYFLQRVFRILQYDIKPPPSNHRRNWGRT